MNAPIDEMKLGEELYRSMEICSGSSESTLITSRSASWRLRRKCDMRIAVILIIRRVCQCNDDRQEVRVTSI